MPSYTAEFSETFELLATNVYVGASSEQNLPASSWINAGDYHRIVVILTTETVGTTLDADVEMSTDDSGSSIATVASITQLTADDNNVLIEIPTAALFSSGTNYPYLRVETTPSGSCNYVVSVYGYNPRYLPVSTDNWDEVITA